MSLLSKGFINLLFALSICNLSIKSDARLKAHDVNHKNDKPEIRNVQSNTQNNVSSGGQQGQSDKAKALIEYKKNTYLAKHY